MHSHTVVRADGSDRMPHWKRDNYWACVEGTPGCAAPELVAPAVGEALFPKSFYSAFSNPDLEGALRADGVEVVVVAGVYLHACVSATVLDAYQRGFSVWVASDAVASPERRQAEVARHFLDGRAATFVSSAVIVDRLEVAR